MRGGSVPAACRGVGPVSAHDWNTENWRCTTCGVAFSIDHRDEPCARVVDAPVVEAVPGVDWSTVNRSFSS